MEVLNNDETVFEDVYPKVLYFTAKWCGPCQRISPIYKELANSKPEIKFFKIDVDQNEKITSAFDIKSMPTFLFFKNESEYKRFSGADSNKLNQHVNWLVASDS